MSSYILGESEKETERLLRQATRDPARQRLVNAGLSAGMTVVDAGCGPGTLSPILSELIGPTGKLLGFDLSEARIEAARERFQGECEAEFRVGTLESPPFDGGIADFVVCQFVLEYCPDPTAAINGLVSLLKPGGILLVVDGDGIGVNNWPMPPEVERGIPMFTALVARTGFDPFVGRKLYSLVRASGLRDVSVNASPWLTAGAAGDEEVSNWTQRFAAVAPLGIEAFGSKEAYDEFVEAYMAMLNDPDSLKFIDIFSVRGVR